MGPCVRRDDPLRDCARPRPYQPTLSLVICDSPAWRGEVDDAERRQEGVISVPLPYPGRSGRCCASPSAATPAGEGGGIA